MKRIVNILLVLSFSTSFAIENITIKGSAGALNKPKLAIVKFDNDVDNLSSVVANDFSITGEYDVNTYSSMSLVKASDYIISGKVTKSANGAGLSYMLNNSKTKSKLMSADVSVGKNVRFSAHLLSNAVYKKLTNTKGVFTSKIAYATLNSDYTSSIYVADYDGYNAKSIINSKKALSSISWSPDGKSISYVSYEKDKPIVFVQNLTTGNRYMVSNFFGSNSSPAFVDDSLLIVTLGMDDGSHLYLVPNKQFTKGRAIRNFINYGSIDTEANVSSAGDIVFTSDYNGGPQIFLTNMSGATPKCITSSLSNYNTTARFSHDAKFITFISVDQSRNYKTYVMNLASNISYPVTSGTSRDIAPTFSPNDKMILFSSDNQMYITSVDGTSQTMLPRLNIRRLFDLSWSSKY